MKSRYEKNIIRLAIVILFIILVFPNINNIFGAINEDYKGAVTSVANGLDVSGNEKSNIISKPIFWLINTFGSIGESLLTDFAKLLATTTENNIDGETLGIMPWADAIIYNGVPALDVNFINPSAESFSSVLSRIISKMYYTVFSISITFFGIAVLVMAIRLATTALAAEKAKYKEAMTDFIISLILIFSLHYFMSFCFYLNESLVKVAFNIAEVQLKGNFTKMVSNATEAQKAMVNKISSDGNDFAENWFGDVMDEPRHFTALKNYISETLFDDGDMQRAAQLLASGYGDFLYDNKGDLANESTELGRSIVLTCMSKLVVDGTTFDSVSGSYGENWDKNDQLYLKLKSAYDELFYNKKIEMDVEGFGTVDLEVIRDFKSIYKDCFDILNKGVYSDKETTIMQAINDAISNMNSTSVNGKTTSMEDLGNSVVSQLAVYFKINRYDAEGDISLVGAIVYTIFVFQSIMYFFSYLKRFFYIIVLSFFAPFMVLYDFVSKIIGGKGNTLSKWIKEFCALVFLQTIQAFLLTMVAGLIMNVNEEIVNTENGLGQSAAQGLAVINIIALASMAKLEQLITDMLGMKSSITDASLAGGAKMGMHGLAGGMMTLAAAKRIGDNGKKVLGGVRNTISANRDYKNALAAKNRKAKQFQELIGANGGPNNIANIQQGNAQGGNGQNGNNQVGNNQVGNNQAGNGAGGIIPGGNGQNNLSLKDKHKYQDAMEACDAKIREAKKNRINGILGAVGGVMETGGAIAGGITGAAFAGTAHAASGTFDLKDVMSDAIKGAGVGDAIAETTLNAVSGTVGAARDLGAGFGKTKISLEIRQKQAAIKNAFQNSGFDVSDLE